MEQTKLQLIVELLERLISGELDADTALERWPDAMNVQDILLQRVWHDLYHYQNDSDIRAKDERYAQKQMQDLENGLAKIKKRFEL